MQSAASRAGVSSPSAVHRPAAARAGGPRRAPASTGRAPRSGRGRSRGPRSSAGSAGRYSLGASNERAGVEDLVPRAGAAAAAAASASRSTRVPANRIRATRRRASGARRAAAAQSTTAAANSASESGQQRVRRRGRGLPSAGGHGTPIGVSVKRRTIRPTAIVSAPTAKTAWGSHLPRPPSPGHAAGVACHPGRAILPRCLPVLPCALALAGCGSRPADELPPAAPLAGARPPNAAAERDRRRAHVHRRSRGERRARRGRRRAAAPASSPPRSPRRGRRRAGRGAVRAASACSSSSTPARCSAIGRADAGSGPGARRPPTAAATST